MSVTFIKSEPPVCQECGMRLKSWSEYHPLSHCELRKAGIAAHEIRRQVGS